MIRFAALILISLFFLTGLKAQYASFKISPNGDTLNAIDKKGLKQGKWVISTPELRGNPGYDEEGAFKNDKREGVWRRFTAQGDLIAYENYKYGGKDGVQKYLNFLGQLEREESWHSYNPESPYDTIPVYGTDGQIMKYNIVRATQYSVPDGVWKYYQPETGAVDKMEKYRRGLLLKDDPKENPDLANENASDTTNAANKTTTASSTDAKDKPKVKPKPPEVLEYEKKLSKKKRAALSRTGETGL